MRIYGLLVLCLLKLVSVADAATLDVLVEGTPIHLPMPIGYCALDTRYSADRLAFQYLAAMAQQQNVQADLVLALYLNCEQLYSIRSGNNNVEVVDYGFYSTPQPIKHIKETRQKFVELAEQELVAKWKTSNIQIFKLLHDYAGNIPEANLKSG
jgi:hypothetical protein